MLDVISREAVYLWYYFDIQLRQILPYWALGIFIGSAVSVFGKEKIHRLLTELQEKHLGVVGIIPASLLGIASPLCMYGTIPIAASFSEKGLRDDYLAAFMMSSVLLNPQLLIYSAALGSAALTVRFVSCFLCGVLAGVLVRIFYNPSKAVSRLRRRVPFNISAGDYNSRSNDEELTLPVADCNLPQAPFQTSLMERPSDLKEKNFFNFKKFEERAGRDTDPNIFLRLLKNIGRNIKATGPYFLAGIVLSALFQRYVPAEDFANLFNNERFGLLMAATIGVPLYMCGGGTIPLLSQWLASGMSMGAAASFMITGPSTKITNLGALKIVLGAKHFAIYILYVIVFSLVCGAVVNLIF